VSFDATTAEVPLEKITEYLLNPTHPMGQFKARWRIAQGFSPLHPVELQSFLLQALHSGLIEFQEDNPFGTKYIVHSTVQMPSGRRASIRTVWLETQECPLRLITAYPA